MSKPQLFMIHFAGGNCYSFKFMEPYLKEFEIEAVELPGRGMRTNERLITDFSLAANDICMQIKNKLRSKHFLIYGHSMGALLALKVVKMLEDYSLRPLLLIVTGNPGPKISENKKRYLLGDLQFIEEVQKLGGIPKEVLESKELLEYFIPIFKSDFEVSEKNGLDERTIVNTPIYCFMGDSEKHHTEISNWAKYTKAQFDYQKLSGNHFFIHSHPKIISDTISKCYIKFKSYE
jgi:external thioesterase TEII